MIKPTKKNMFCLLFSFVGPKPTSVISKVYIMISGQPSRLETTYRVDIAVMALSKL